MSLLADERIPTFVGAVTVVAGAALLIAPGRLGPPAGLGTDQRIVRAIGVADLALTPGLLAGRPRWPWMVARAGLNVAIAAHYARVAAAPGARPASKAGAIALSGLTVVDGAAAVALRAAGR